MSVQWLSWAFESAEVTGGQRLVLLSLANHADDSGVCWPSIDTLSREARLSRRRVEQAMRALVKEGLVLRQVNAAPVTGHGGYRPNLYRLVKSPSAELSTPPDDVAPANPSGPTDVAPAETSGPDESGPAVCSTAGGDVSSSQGGTKRPGKPSVEPSIEPSQPQPTTNSPGTALALVTELSPAAAIGNPVQVVFDTWREATGRTGRTKLDTKRRRLITNALSDYPLDDVLDAVRGWRFSPHHRGENDAGTVYNDLELLLRSSQHIERFRDMERRTQPTRPARRAEPASFDAIRDAVDRRRRGSA